MPIVLRNWLKKHWFELGIFFTSFLLRFFTYQSHPFANGWDAYFYIVQIKSYMEEGAMHSSRISLIYPLLLSGYFLVQNYELTYQLVSAIIVGAFSFQMYRTAAALNQRSDVKYLIAAFTLFSPQLTYVGAQFPKNLLGVVVLLVLIECLIKKSYLKAGISVIASFFIHKMTAGLSILLAVAFPLGDAMQRYIRYLFIGSILAIAILILFPDILVAINIDRDGFGFGKAVFHSKKFIELISVSITAPWIAEIVVINILVLIISLLILTRKETSYKWVVLLSLLLLLTFPLLEWSALGLSYRLLMVFLIMGSLAFSYFNFQIKVPLLIICCSLFTAGGIHTALSYPSHQLDPPYGKYKLLTDKIEAIDRLKPELIIIHKAFAEYYTFKTGKDALPWIPEYTIDPNKLWRVVYGVNSKTISYYANQPADISNQLFELSPWYLIVREDLWSVCLRRIKTDDPYLFEEINSWKNPNVIRPDYLIKKH